MIINLDNTFKPFGSGAEYDSFMFPSGFEQHIKIHESYPYCLITCRFKSSDDIMKLLLATDALKRLGVKNISIFISYLPYARQDRVMVKGEPLSLKVFSNLINSQGYSRVSIFDPHSEVSLALIDNSVGIDNHDFVKSVLEKNGIFETIEAQDSFLMVCPDAGAYKKIFKLCQYIGYTNDIVLCDKARDVNNGQIKKITVNSTNLNGKDVYIVDDICDGAGTFLGIAKELKKLNCGKINLIVSHGIFSKGEDCLKEYIDHVYTTDSVKTIKSDYIEQIELHLNPNVL